MESSHAQQLQGITSPHHLWDPLGIQLWVLLLPSFSFSFFFFSSFFLMLVLASYTQNFTILFTITELTSFFTNTYLNSILYWIHSFTFLSLSYNLSHYSDVKFLFKYLCAYKLFMFLLLLLWQADMSVGFGNTHSQHKTVWGHHQDWLEKLQKSKIIFFIKKQSTFCEAPTKPHRFNQSVPRVSNVFHVLISTRHYPTRTLFSFSLFGVPLSHCVCVTLPEKIILCIR